MLFCFSLVNWLPFVPFPAFDYPPALSLFWVFRFLKVVRGVIQATQTASLPLVDIEIYIYMTIFKQAEVFISIFLHHLTRSGIIYSKRH